MDAETYLRCRLEDALVGRLPAIDELRYRVRAAYAVGAVGDLVAERVLADAQRASALRSPGQHDAAQDERPFDPPHVVVRPTAIACDWGTLVITHLVFGEHSTVFGAQGTLSTPVRHRHRRPDAPWDTLEVIDAAGTRFEAHYSGSSSDTSFDGEYELYPALDRATTSVTVAGRTFDLATQPEAPLVRVDALDGLTPLDRADRHLDLLTPPGSAHMYYEDVERPIARETLTALGLEVPDRSAPAPRRRARPARHRQPAARSRWIGIGTTTPLVDGVVMALTSLSDDGTMSLMGHTVGPLTADHAWPPMRIDAVDDLGNRYATSEDSHSYGEREFGGRLRFTPALAARASTLTVGVDLLRHRLELDVPLDWQDVR